MSKALVVIDVQNDYFEQGGYPQWKADEILGTVAEDDGVWGTGGTQLII